MKRELELHGIDIKEFVEEIDKCKGNVFLITSDGDKLNLKSKFCQIIGLTNIIQGGNIDEAKIICELQEDESRLFRFNLYGKNREEK